MNALTEQRLYDTCATGVVYFHRFYMFHSFKEFYRYVSIMYFLHVFQVICLDFIVHLRRCVNIC